VLGRRKSSGNKPEKTIKNIFCLFLSPNHLLPGGKLRKRPVSVAHSSMLNQTAHPSYALHGNSHIFLPLGQLAASATKESENDCPYLRGLLLPHGILSNSHRQWALSAVPAVLLCGLEKRLDCATLIALPAVDLEHPRPSGSQRSASFLGYGQTQDRQVLSMTADKTLIPVACGMKRKKNHVIPESLHN
jgi:hypothetical protein